MYQDSEPAVIEPSGVIKDLPLWRVQWTELPGFQNVLNVWQPSYTHMFSEILAGPEPRIFGHLLLPGGTNNLGKPDYGLGRFDTKASVVGTLMKITDSKRMDDGRLIIVVQALERMVVVNCTREVPYSVATVALLPDLDRIQHHAEAGQGALTKSEARAAAAAEGLHWGSFENLATVFNDKAKGVSQIIPMDKNGAPSELTRTQAGAVEKALEDMKAILAQEADPLVIDSLEEDLEKAGLLIGDSSNRGLEELEYDVWIAVDTLIRLVYQLNPNKERGIPLPTQFLGLLPPTPPKPWPMGFQFTQVVAELAASKQLLVGTATLSPFVRVPENDNYPSYRRARRLSYVVTCLLENISIEGEGPPEQRPRQDLLEVATTKGRLAAVRRKLDLVNNALRASLP